MNSYCNFCGEDMLPLFTGLFCKNNCDKLPKDGSKILEWEGNKYRYIIQKVKDDFKIPPWAVFAWNQTKFPLDLNNMKSHEGQPAPPLTYIGWDIEGNESIFEYGVTYVFFSSILKHK